jgi:hypothetical protein
MDYFKKLIGKYEKIIYFKTLARDLKVYTI